MPGVRRAARGARSSSRRSRSSARSQHAIAVAGIGCYTSFSRHDRRRPRAGAARPRAVGRDRREAHAARRARVHAAGRRRHGERRAAGGAAHRGARRERHVHPAEQRRVRRDRRPHDRDERDRPAHEEHARRPRRRVPRLPDPDRRPHRAARRARRTSPADRCTTPASVARTKKMFRRAFETQVARRGLLVRRGAHDVPDRLVHPDRRGPRLHAARRWARCTSWASSRSTAACARPRSCTPRTSPSSTRSSRARARRAARLTDASTMDFTYPPEAEAFRKEFRGWLDANLPADLAGAGSAGRSRSTTTQLERLRGVEPRARRRALRRDRVARGVGRPRRGRHGAGRVRRGDAPRRARRAR